MFELNGVKLTLEQLQNHAKEKGYDFDQYMSNMRTAGLVELNKITGRSPAKTFETFTNVLKAIPQIATDSEERAELAKYMKNRIDNIPESFQTALISSQAAARDLFTADLDDLGYNEKQKEIREKSEKIIIEKYNKLDELEFKDTGKGIVAGAKEGDAASLIAGVFGAGVSMAETAIPAFLTFGASLPIQVAAPMYTEYNKAKAKQLYGDDPNAIEKLVQNDQTEIAVPMALGAIATGLEYIGLKGVTKYIQSVPGKGAKLAKLTWISTGEGFTEVGQLGVEKLNSGLGSGKSIEEASADAWDAMTSDEGLEMWLNGFLGAGQMSVAGRALNRALRSDNASVKDLNNKINNLADLNNRKYNTRNQDVKDAVDLEIKEAEKDLKNYITEKRKISEILNEDQKKSLINTINEKDNIKSKVESLKTQLQDNKISSKEFGYAVRSLNNQDKILTEQIELINATAKEQLLQTSLETTKEEAGKLGLEQIELSQEEFTKLFPDDADSDGAISGNKIYINRDVARQTGAIGVGSHELLHGIIGNSYQKLGKEEKVKLNTEFLNLLGSKEKQAILGRLANSYGITGDKVFETEELFTAFSDEIIDGGLSFNEGVFGKIKNTVHKVLNKFGYKKEFESARQTYNFLKDYSKNIKEGKLTERAREFAKQDPGVKKTRMSRSKLIDTINDLQQGATTKADFQKPETFNKVFEAVQSGGAINNYIRSLGMSSEKTQETIDAVTDRLINFDPAAKRKDGTVIGPKGLGEFIMANVGFGKLVAAKKLAVKAEKKKRTTRIDDPDIKDIPDDTPTPDTPTETVDQKQPKKRKLKDFDVELQDGLVNDEIVKKVEALLEKNPSDIEVQMEKLILGEIRKMLSNVIPKIAKDKKTGVTKPTLEYEAWVRNQYDEVVRSLGIKTIRDAYSPWFQRKKVRTEKYKNIDPITDKVSNYVKDVFENTTNKREYIRWFLEGKPGVLTERRTALIRRIARRKTEVAIDNYIEENSKDLNAVSKARFRNLSKTAENTLDEQKTFDSVKFSKSDKKTAEKLGVEYYDLNNIDGVNKYISEFATKIVPIFEEGFLNKTISITSSTIADRDLRKYAKKELEKLVKFKRDKKYSRVKFDTKLVRSKTDKQIQDLNDKNVDNFTYMWNAIYKAVQKDKSLVTPLLHFLRGSINEGVHPHRLGAPLLAIDKTVEGKLYFEHALQNAKAYRLLIEAAINNNSTEWANTLKSLKKNYKLIAISAKDNKKIDEAGLKNEMAIDKPWNIYENNWWERYFNEAIAMLGGINPNNLKLIGSKISLGQQLNIGIDGKISVLKTDSKQQKTLSNAIAFSRSNEKTTKGITVLDFDDTLATTESLVKYTKPDGTVGTLNAEEYASTYEDLLDMGYTFDFSDFNKVVKGKLAPLFQKALKLQGKFGPENMFVLTARPPQAQKAIFDFLKANGLNIPLKNITGLGNSTAEAKALWIADKVGEGYNDFYFADDALQNVQAVKNMLDQFDVKSKIQQARANFYEILDSEFNKILQNVTGIEANKRYSQAKGRKRGEGKGRFRIFVPPSHEDFSGLLYNFIGKGEQGNKHRDFFEKALIKPLNKAYQELNSAKQAIANDYRGLIKQFPKIRKQLTNKTPDGDYFYSDAVRVYLWEKSGFEVPGMSKSDVKELSDIVKADTELQSFAEAIGLISKQKEGYIEPNEHWETGDIRTDLADATGRVGRKQFFTEFIENSDKIFSKENLNKIEAAYGRDFREALEDILQRTKTGTNRTIGPNKIVNKFLDYLNGSIGATMFFNARSAVLQTISTVNFINYGDNNIFKASKAFANQKQFWKDFSMIFNSDMLRQRRAGTAFDVNAAELSSAVAKSKEPVRAAIRHLLQIGFLPTQIADSFAIALGGSSMYRNRVSTYTKQGLSQKEAEAKAFTDFQEIAETTQQSARPDKISQEQASPLGRMILAFQNTPSQYVRLIKKAGLDLINRRKTPPYKNQVNSDMSNVSKIIYYGAVQNVIFYGLQTALFAMMFDDEDQDEEFFSKKRDRILSGSIDTILRGMGVGGAIISTIKNTAIKWAEQQGKGWGKEDNALMMEMLQLSPPIGIKARKLSSAEKTYDYNKKVIKEMETFDIDNPIWGAVGNTVEATTNVPLARLHRKTMNLRQAANAENEWWQRLAMALGWSQWDVGVKNEEVEDVKKKIKDTKKKNKKSQYKQRFKPMYK